MSYEHCLYLDHAGANIPPRELLSAVCKDLMENTYSNPHSSSGATGTTISDRTEAMICDVRKLVLEQFDAPSDQYDVVFTAGTTASMQLVAECFPWSDASSIIYPMNAHTSLLGVRSYAPTAYCVSSAELQCTEPSQTSAEHRVSKRTDRDIDATTMTNGSASEYSLLVVPGECNFSGAKANLPMIAQMIRSENDIENLLSKCTVTKSSNNGIGDIHRHKRQQWLWLLDAAKLSSTSPLRLNALPTDTRPHFVCVSFYKLFGYPTGLGALIIRRDAAASLKKRYYGGGTLLAGAADGNFIAPKNSSPHEYLEDGTINYYGIAAVRHGLNYIRSIGGMEIIQQETMQLTTYLVQRMKSLHHRENNVPLCVFYNKYIDIMASSTSPAELCALQGPIVTFNLQWCNEEPVEFIEVGRRAAEESIQLRTGCFCNIGACQEAFQLNAADAERNFELGRICSDSRIDLINGTHTGAVRVSLGLGSTKADCDRFIDFLRCNFLNKSAPRAGLPSPVRQQMNSHLSKTSVAFGITAAKRKRGHFNIMNALGFSCDTKAHVAQDDDEGDENNSIPRPIYLAAVFVYPIKSCAGMRVENWPLCPTGLLYDRCWVISDMKDGGKAITQKRFPRLALVHPVIDLQKNVMTVYSPHCEEPLIIPLQGSQQSFPSEGCEICCDQQQVQVCGALRSGRNVSVEANSWFSNCLHPEKESYDDKMRRYSLVRSTDGDKDSSKGKVSFSNSAQFLLVSAESVRALIDMIKESNDTGIKSNALNIGIENFRPNLVVCGGDGMPHQEDDWQEITIDSNNYHTALRITGPCARCSMVNVNSVSGAMDCRAFQALATYRKEKTNVYFGQFCSLSGSADEPPKSLQVGSVVHVQSK